MLPREIRETLPESIDPDQITAVLSLKTGLGSSWGETCVLLHGTRMLALSRDSVLDPFQVLELDAETPPRLDIHSWEEKLHLTAIDGKEYGLLFSELDKKEALEGLGTMYEALEAWPAWVAVLEFQLELATITERRVELMVQLGQLHLVRLDQPDKAAELFQKVLEQAPLNTEATEGLESLLGDTPQ
ncbi:MAG: hypothetical protein AAFS10_28160, partial [Myxococcota bacterium]